MQRAGEAMTGKLRTDPNLRRPDDVYQALLDAQEHLAPEDADRFRARLILLLANQVGNDQAVLEAIERAAEGLPTADESP
jgi:hypothetical protein